MTPRHLSSKLAGLVGTGAIFKMFELTIGVVAALVFPVLAIIVHRQREASRNRRAGRRRTDRISL